MNSCTWYRERTRGEVERREAREGNGEWESRERGDLVMDVVAGSRGGGERGEEEALGSCVVVAASRRKQRRSSSLVVWIEARRSWWRAMVGGEWIPRGIWLATGQAPEEHGWRRRKD